MGSEKENCLRIFLCLSYKLCIGRYFVITEAEEKNYFVYFEKFFKPFFALDQDFIVRNSKNENAVFIFKESLENNYISIFV